MSFKELRRQLSERHGGWGGRVRRTPPTARTLLRILLPRGTGKGGDTHHLGPPAVRTRPHPAEEMQKVDGGSPSCSPLKSGSPPRPGISAGPAPTLSFPLAPKEYTKTHAPPKLGVQCAATRGVRKRTAPARAQYGNEPRSPQRSSEQDLGRERGYPRVPRGNRGFLGTRKVSEVPSMVQHKEVSLWVSNSEKVPPWSAGCRYGLRGVLEEKGDPQSPG